MDRHGCCCCCLLVMASGDKDPSRKIGNGENYVERERKRGAGCSRQTTRVLRVQRNGERGRWKECYLTSVSPPERDGRCGQAPGTCFNGRHQHTGDRSESQEQLPLESQIMRLMRHQSPKSLISPLSPTPTLTVTPTSPKWCLMTSQHHI